MKTILFLLLAVTTVYAQKADTLKMSAEASLQYNKFQEEQRNLSEQFQKVESARFFFLQGFIEGNKRRLTDADSVYFVAPDKIVIAKRRKTPPKKE